MLHRSRLSAFLLLIAIASAGCSTKQQTRPLSQRDADARVRVENNNWLDMAIYAERGSMRQRIGTVTSMGREMLTIPRNMLASVSSIRLIASPIGSPSDYATQPVDVWPGDTVDFTIQNSIGISSVSTW